MGEEVGPTVVAVESKKLHVRTEGLAGPGTQNSAKVTSSS